MRGRETSFFKGRCMESQLSKCRHARKEIVLYGHSHRSPDPDYCSEVCRSLRINAGDYSEDCLVMLNSSRDSYHSQMAIPDHNSHNCMNHTVRLAK